MKIPIQIIESPYGATNQEARRTHYLYARACQRDALVRHGASLALASHVNTIGALAEQGERALGIDRHLAFLEVLARSDIRASACLAVYIDLGMTEGMLLARDFADRVGISVVARSLGEGWLRALPKGVGQPY